ncbi:MAG: HlyD family type I secretion periplasmic adaptor subunit [Pseudomonadota bacterium]
MGSNRLAVARTATELEFLPAALEVLETPPPASSRILGWLVVVLFALLILWLCLGKVDSVVTADGELTPAGNVKAIQPARSGTVAKLHVTDGQTVAAGDVLLEIDAADTDAQIIRSRRQLAFAALEYSRVASLMRRLDDDLAPIELHGDVPPEMRRMARARFDGVLDHVRQESRFLNAEIERAHARHATVSARLAKSQALLPVSVEREARMASLLQRGAVARPQWLSAQENLIALRHDIDIQRTEMATSVAARKSAQQALTRYEARIRRDLIGELNTLAEQRAALSVELARLAVQRRQAVLSAPVSGRVHELGVHHVGAVVTAGSAVMRIVPADAALTATAWLDNQDAGFVAPGQVAEVKLHGFPFTRFGALGARVVDVAPDAARGDAHQTRYRVRAGIDRQHLSVGPDSVPLTAGMQLSLEVKIRQRRIISYLLEPVLRALGEALKER